MVVIGSARSNENGGINGGKPGDQTGKEVSTQAWYLHSKGWIVIRAKSKLVRKKIAHNMKSICSNDNIGYCQNHRGSLTVQAKPYGYDASKVTTPCESDCSESVRNCILYAGIQIESFSTGSEVAACEKTGMFDIITDEKHCKSADYLLEGDILVTKTKGHTVVVLTDGEKAGSESGAEVTVKNDSAKSYEKNISGTYTVTASALNLRAGAGTTKKIVGTLKKGKKARCYGYYTEVYGVKWLLVQTEEMTGFCSEKYLKK